MAVVVLFAVNLLWFHPANSNESQFAHVRLAGVILLAASLLGVAGLALFKRRSESAIRGLGKRFARWGFVPERVGRAILSLLEQLAGALSILTDARELAVVAAWTALLWGTITVANVLVMRAFGLPFGLPETVFVMGFALIGSLVPTPGGAAGAFHAATAAGLIFLGVAREQAVAVTIVLNPIIFGPALTFGLYYLLRGEVNIKRLRQLTTPEEVEHAVEDEIIHPPDKTEAADEALMVHAGE
jgi:uncharacterized membrane protein YbhN (UPF0104 family)